MKLKAHGITFEVSRKEYYWNKLFPLENEHWCWAGFGYHIRPVFSFIWLAFWVIVYDHQLKKWSFERFTD